VTKISLRKPYSKSLAGGHVGRDYCYRVGSAIDRYWTYHLLVLAQHLVNLDHISGNIDLTGSNDPNVHKLLTFHPLFYTTHSSVPSYPAHIYDIIFISLCHSNRSWWHVSQGSQKSLALSKKVGQTFTQISLQAIQY
jgi:hypothetical protein